MLLSGLPSFVVAQGSTPDITSDYYYGFINANGTMRFANKSTGATIVDNAPSYFLNYGSNTTSDVSPVNPSFETDSNSDGIPDGWTIDKTFIRQSSDVASNGTKSLKFDTTMLAPSIADDTPTLENPGAAPNLIKPAISPMVATDDSRAYSSLIAVNPDKSYSVSVDSYYGSFISGSGYVYAFYRLL